MLSPYPHWYEFSSCLSHAPHPFLPLSDTPATTCRTDRLTCLKKSSTLPNNLSPSNNNLLFVLKQNITSHSDLHLNHNTTPTVTMAKKNNNRPYYNEAELANVRNIDLPQRYCTTIRVLYLRNLKLIYVTESNAAVVHTSKDKHASLRSVSSI